jgi:hypothetical protein
VLTFPYETTPVLNIWLGYAVEKGNSAVGVEVSKRIAQEAGLSRVVFQSPQTGWTDKFKKITTWYEV